MLVDLADQQMAGRRAVASESARLSVFLMTNTLERGGSERQFVTLAQSLDPSAFSLHLGCLAERGPFRQELGNMELFDLGGSLYTLRSFQTRRRLSRLLRKHHIDIAHAFDFYTNLVLIPVAKFARVPVIIGSQRQIGDLLTPAQFRAQLFVFRLCDKVVCNSQAAADHLRDHGVRPDKLVIIGNGIPPEAFADTPPAIPRVPGQLRVGMIARMNHRVKNHDIFLRAAARVAASFPNAEFVLVGDGPLRPEFEQQAGALGIANRVRFLGDRRDIPAILASLDVTVLPSGSESLSNSIIESMAAGVPVVATRVGGNTELIRDTGVLVNPADELGLATALESLLRDEPLRKSLGRKATTFALEHFTIDRMRRSHEQLYRDLLNAKQGGRKVQ